MKIHFNATREKATHTIQNHRRYIVYHSRLSTLAANIKRQNITINTSGIHLKEHLGTLFSQPLNMHILVPPVPVWSCLHHKNTTRFLDLQDRFIRTWKDFKTIRRKRLRIPSTTNLGRHIVYHSWLSTLEHEKTSKLSGEKGYVYHPQRILDDISSTIHGFLP